MWTKRDHFDFAFEFEWEHDDDHLSPSKYIRLDASENGKEKKTQPIIVIVAAFEHIYDEKERPTPSSTDFSFSSTAKKEIEC